MKATGSLYLLYRIVQYIDCKQRVLPPSSHRTRKRAKFRFTQTLYKEGTKPQDGHHPPQKDSINKYKKSKE